MGKQLKTADILGDLKDENDQEPAPKSVRAVQRPRLAEMKETARKASEGKPSPYEADLRAKLRDKTQLNFGGIPKFVRDEFERLAGGNNMKMREYLYHLLRKEGAEIPAYDEMDGRRL